MSKSLFDKIADDLDAVRDYMGETITLEDMQRLKGLRRIILAADDISNRISRPDMEWVKMQD